MSEFKKAETAEAVEANERRKFTFLVLLASLLSLGSIIWSTYSLLDLYQPGGLDMNNLGEVSPIALSAAATADIAWSATLYAEYRGVRLMFNRRGKGKKPVNLVPIIGWLEVLFLVSLLAYHGSRMGGGEAAFAAVLPLLTRVAWMFAMADLKDPYDLTDEEKAEIAETHRASRRKAAQADATAEEHEADMTAKRRKHEAEMADRKAKHAAELADEKAKNEAEIEAARAKAEKDRLEAELKHELETDALRRSNDLKLMKAQLDSRLAIDTMRSRQEITLERLDAEAEIALRQPMLIRGEVLSGGSSAPVAAPVRELAQNAGLSLSDGEMKQLAMARQYYAANHVTGGITKASFCEANRIRPPRLSEATRRFPLNWFEENDLVDWLGDDA